MSLTVKEAGFLSYALLARNLVTKDEAANAIWSRVSIERSRHSLNQLLYVLRRKIPQVEISTADGVVRLSHLSSDFQELIDLAEAGKFREAVRTYNGRFLGPEEIDDPRLADWRDGIDQSLSRIAITCLQEWQRCGRPDINEIISCAERILALHPESDTARSIYIDSLIADNQFQKARLHYAMFKRDPEFPVNSKLEAVLGNQAAAENTPSDEGVDLRTTRFVGRSQEINRLFALWQSVRDVRGQTILLEGESGIGKTRLSVQLLRKIVIGGGGAWVLHCNAATQRVRYSGIGELLREHVPGLKQRLENDPTLQLLFGTDPGATDVQEHVHRLVYSVTSLVQQESKKQPLVILVDDAQWADEFTALLLTYWSVKLRGDPVMLLIVVRTEDSVAVPSWILTDLSPTHRLTLLPLSDHESADLASAWLDGSDRHISEGAKALALEQSAGRPYLLLESLSALATPTGGPIEGILLPKTVESVLKRRLLDLSTAAIELAGLVAAAGRSLEVPTLRRLAPRCQVNLNGLDSLTARGVLRWEGGAVGFPHDLMRETVYRSISPLRRMEIHEGIAQFLSVHGAADGQLALHYAAAGDEERAGFHGERAAEQALRMQLLTDAEHFMRFNTVHGTPAQKAAGAARLAYYLIKVGRTYEVRALTTLINAETDDGQLLTRILALEDLIVAPGIDPAAIIESARDLLHFAVMLGKAEWVAVASTLCDVGIHAAFTALGDEVLDAMRVLDTDSQPNDVRLQLRAFAAAWWGMSRDYRQGYTMLTSYFANDAVGIGSPSMLALLANVRGTLQLLSGHLTAALESFSTAVEAAQAGADLRRSAAGTLNRGVSLMELGHFDDAHNHFGTLLNHPNPHIRVKALANLTLLHFDNNDYGTAQAIADTLASVSAAHSSEMFCHVADAVRGSIQLDIGNVASAEQYAAKILSLRSENAFLVVFPITAFLVRVKLARGDVEGAVSLCETSTIACERRDRLAYLRIRLQMAETVLFGRQDANTAYSIANEVLAESSEMNAALISARSRHMLETSRFA